jgi:hypothetical protein
LTYAGAITFTTSYACSPNNNCNQNGLTANFSSVIAQDTLSLSQNTIEVSAEARVSGNAGATGYLSIDGSATLDIFLTTDGPVRPGLMTYTTGCGVGPAPSGGGSGSILLNGNVLGSGYSCYSNAIIPMTLGQTFELQVSAFAGSSCNGGPCLSVGDGEGVIFFTAAENRIEQAGNGRPDTPFLVAVSLVPEPSASTLLALGAATLFLLRAKGGQRRDDRGGNR